jgi:hypothetical protein
MQMPDIFLYKMQYSVLKVANVDDDDDDDAVSVPVWNQKLILPHIY